MSGWPDVGHENVLANGVRLHVATAGPGDGPAVVLLHGFPEAWFGWRHQIGALAGAGFRVIAPDQRGYNTSDKPARVADYRLDELAGDVVGLLDALGLERAAVVGHDWGSVVGWWVALRYPERVSRLMVMNAPHPVAYRRTLKAHPSQWLRSWYAFYFQLPGLPEFGMRIRNWKALADGLRKTSRPGTFSDEDLERYREAWSQPGAMRAMIHWYRAALRHHPRVPEDPRIKVPTLILWGAQDAFIHRDAATFSLELCEQGRLEWVEEATHWVQHEEPGRVNERLLDFLRPGDGATSATASDRPNAGS